jgi:hypothetical protein
VIELKLRVCGASGSVAAITQVHCLCDISCCLDMDRERLQEYFSWTDVRTVIKFNALLGKSALECYKSLKEGLGTHAPSYETVHRWVNFIKNGRGQTMLLAMEPQRRRLMNSM